MGISAPFFTDTVPERYFLPEIMGGGASWTDYDRDGILDLYLTNGALLEPRDVQPSRGNWLYRGRVDAAFALVDESLGAGDKGYGQGCAFGDFNADGFADLYVANFGPNALYINQGDGTFALDQLNPVMADPRWSSSVVWLDLNRDELLDLYVVNYMDVTSANRKVCQYEGRPGYCGPGQYSSIPDAVFLNQGDGRFIESAEKLGLIDTIGKGLAVQVADFNADLVPEIYVANDMTANFLFVLNPADSQQGVTYREVAGVGGVAQSGEGMNEASMGISCTDFDGDGLPDLYLTHYFNMQNTLYKNYGDLQFEDVSRRVGTAKTGFEFLGFGTVPIDYNGDGYDDLFVANGHVLGPQVKPDRMRPQILYNNRGKVFEDVSKGIDGYFQQEWLGRGAASADFDNDGDQDIVVTHLDDPAALLRNSTETDKSFVGFEMSTSSRISPVGTRVTITSPAGEKTRAVMAGGSYLSTSDDRLLFHVDGNVREVAVRIEWASGAVDEIPALGTSRYWHVSEGQTPW